MRSPLIKISASQDSQGIGVVTGVDCAIIGRGIVTKVTDKIVAQEI